MTPEQQLEQLERSLWQTETRFDRNYMEQILTPDFFEFGRSGRKWSREEVLDYFEEEIKAELSDMKVHFMDEKVALVTYLSKAQYEELEISHRSSLWIKNGEQWQLRFHQGTPAQKSS